MRFSIDANVLVYVADARSAARQASAQQIVTVSARQDCVLTVQAIGEFFHATTRKRLASRNDVNDLVRDWTRLFQIVSAGTTDLVTAIQATNAGRFQFYDALLLATAAAAGCTAVISEDMHDGAQLGGVRVVGAFDATGGISAAARALLAP